jgi:hypothetical protein
MTVDIFLFNDEVDILRCRLHQLRSVVDRFIAIEGNLTLAGEPKPYRLSALQAAGEFSLVEVVRADLADLRDVPPQRQAWVAPGMEDHWKRDWKQRAACSVLVDGLDPTTTVMFGDVDEIPRTEVVRDFDGKKSRLMMQMLCFDVGMGTASDSWTGTVIGKRSEMKSFPHEHRSRDHNPMTPRAGWHLTWLGGEEAVIAKVKMFAHGEMAEDIHRVRRLYRERLNPGNSEPLVPYTGDLPAWIEEGHAPASWSAP